MQWAGEGVSVSGAADDKLTQVACSAADCSKICLRQAGELNKSTIQKQGASGCAAMVTDYGPTDHVSD